MQLWQVALCCMHGWVFLGKQKCMYEVYSSWRVVIYTEEMIKRMGARSVAVETQMAIIQCNMLQSLLSH